jgi:hypothetical protein
MHESWLNKSVMNVETTFRIMVNDRFRSPGKALTNAKFPMLEQAV